MQKIYWYFLQIKVLYGRFHIKHLIYAPEIYEMFVYKNTETIEYVKK